jgi:hypothetical protein
VVVAFSRSTPHSSSRRTTTFVKPIGRAAEHDDSGGCSPISSTHH